MTPAILSLLALLLVVGTSLTARLNVGVLAVALAWLVATVGAGWKTDALMATFPSSLFVTLLGVTLLFGVAEGNGTMRAVAHRTVRMCGGRIALLPVVFFASACLLSSSGPGAIAAAALIAPLAMGISLRAGVPPLLTALMVGNGANAGNLSSISAVGTIVRESMTRAGLPYSAWQVWSAAFAAHALAALAAWAMFGGPALRAAGRVATEPDEPPFTRDHLLTLAVLAVWIAAVVLLKVHPGLAAFAAASILVVARIGDDAAMLRAVPWGVIVMVCGVSVLIGVLERTGGMELFTSMLARVATPRTVNGTIAFVTGLISTWSSTSGVVYPAFLPAVPGLVQKLGGGDALQIALSINVGAALVDVSPLSTIGAVCVAALPAGHDSRRLFRSLLLWGLSMSVAGALFCQLFIGLFT